MKIKCKSCHNKIDAADYNCPICGKVNFYTDSELCSAYRKHKVRKVITTLAVIFSVITAFLIPIGINNKKNRESALQNIGYEAANAQCGNNFMVGKVDRKQYGSPFYIFYITYQGEPDSFSADCIDFCISLHENATERWDWYEVIISCNEKVFDYNNESNRAEINFPCELSEFERFKVKSLRILTQNWSEEEKKSLKNDTVLYSFDLVIN